MQHDAQKVIFWSLWYELRRVFLLHLEDVISSRTTSEAFVVIYLFIMSSINKNRSFSICDNIYVVCSALIRWAWRSPPLLLLLPTWIRCLVCFQLRRRISTVLMKWYSSARSVSVRHILFQSIRKLPHLLFCFVLDVLAFSLTSFFTRTVVNQCP